MITTCRREERASQRGASHTATLWRLCSCEKRVSDSVFGVVIAGPLTEDEVFRVEVTPHREWVRVLPIGEVDIQTAPILDRCLTELATSGFSIVEVSLRRVSFLDCAGIRVLIRARQAARTASTKFTVIHPSGQIARVSALVSPPGDGAVLDCFSG